MNTIKKILVTTDSASEISTASRVGADLAARIGAELHILHVVKSYDADYDYAVRDLSKSIQQKVEEELSATSKALDDGSHGGLVSAVRIGSTANQVLQYVQDHNIDLVVIEVRRDGQGTKRLGVLSSALARAVPFDVLFVHPNQGGPFENLLVATDYSESASEAMVRAIDYVKLHGKGSVSAVHSFELPARHYYTGHTPEELREIFQQQSDKHFAEWMGKIETKGLNITQATVEGETADAVLARAKETGADLLVIGSHGRTASSAMMIGSVAQKIALNAECNVWVERSDGDAMGIWAAIKRVIGIE